jgi:hypothetical protein
VGVGYSGHARGLDPVFGQVSVDRGLGRGRRGGGDRPLRAWAPLGSNSFINGSIWALAVFDDGGGEALYVGGSFVTVGGMDLFLFIAKWDGSSWMPLGSGMDGTRAANADIQHSR